MTVQAAHSGVAHSRPLRWVGVGARLGIAASLALMFAGATLQAAKAAGETRTISFHHAHTNENLTVTYKVNGRYDDEALKKINYVLRDWREQQPIKMDPELIDLLWEVHRETGSKEPIWVVCGYRSPETNSMLRKRSRGVAQHSQHMLGKAVDFFIPGVSVEELRAAGLRAQRGGVGYYPSSNFVHLDTGSVRHWPRMPEAQLAKVLARGQLASRNTSDDGSVRRVDVAQADITRSDPPSGMSAFLSKLFGGGDEQETETEATAEAIPAAPAQAAAPASPKIARAATTVVRAPEKPAKVASATEPRREKVGAVPTTQAKPDKPGTYQVASVGSVPAKSASYETASATSTPVAPENLRVAQLAPAAANVKSDTAQGALPQAPARPAQAASLVARANLSANDVINDRGYWQGLPAADPAEAAQTTVSRTTPPVARRAAPDKVATGNLAPWPLNDRGNDRTPSVGALSYASTPSPAPSRLAPVNAGPTRTAPGLPEAAAAAPDELPADRPRKGPDTVQVGDRFNDPWVRAMMLSPSAHVFLRTTLYGSPDYRELGAMFAKPASVLAVKFTQDPTGGLSTERFSGGAVAFNPTVSFVPRTTAQR